MIRKAARNSKTTPHLFDQWKNISQRILSSTCVALFFDFDGTLVPIAPKPDLIRFDAGTRRILEKLSRRRQVSIAVISGRRRIELKSYIQLKNIKYLGIYGWERSEGAKLSGPTRSALRLAHTTLALEIATFPGVWIEAKNKSLSIHLLGTDEETQRQVRRKVHARMKPFRKTLRVITNLRDIEIAPATVEGKGAAVQKLLEEPRLQGALPIYFGDDLSDEPAFTAVRKGISILVGKRSPTRASFYLRDPKEVATTLTRIDKLLS